MLEIFQVIAVGLLLFGFYGTLAYLFLYLPVRLVWALIRFLERRAS